MEQHKNTENTIIFLIIFTLFILLGFLGYYFGFLQFIYNVMMPAAFSNYSLIALSIIFGIAAFFSPCAFTVMPAFISNYLAKGESKLKFNKFFSIHL